MRVHENEAPTREQRSYAARSSWGRRLLLVLGFGLALTGCRDSGGDPVAPTGAGGRSIGPAQNIDGVATVLVYGSGGGTGGTDVNVNDQVQMWVTANASDGRSLVIAGHTVAWASSDPQVASIQFSDPNKEFVTVSALKEGTADISATVDGVRSSNSFRIRVTVKQPAAPARLEISPAPVDIPLGMTKQLTAKLYDSDGREMSFFYLPIWSGDNGGIASIVDVQSGSGSSVATVRGVSMGTTTVRVDYQGLSATATVTVRPFVDIFGPYHISETGSYTFTAEPYGGDGNYTYQWSINTGSGVVPLGTGKTQSVYVDPNNNANGVIVGVQVSSAGGTGKEFKWVTVAIGCGGQDWCG